MIPCMPPEARRVGVEGGADGIGGDLLQLTGYNGGEPGHTGVEPRALAKPGPAPRSCALVARGRLLGFLKVHQPNSRAA
jgi:hypothetical protein